MALVDVIRKALNETELDAMTVEHLERELAKAIREELGGQRLYIPGREKVNREELREIFNGRNIGELMARYGLSRSRIYQIINDP